MKIRIRLFLLLLLIITNTVFAQENNAESTSLVLPQIQVVPIKDSKTGGNYELYIELPEDYIENKDTLAPYEIED